MLKKVLFIFLVTMAINASSQEIKVTSGNSWRARVHIPLEFLLEKE